MSTPTPRTDAEVKEIDVAYVGYEGLASEPQKWVSPDFARTLETDLAAAERRIAAFERDGYFCELERTKTDLAAARAEVERLKASANHHRELGITLLDAKWLDPQCHQGCQSLLLKARAERAEAEVTALREDKARLDWLLHRYSYADGRIDATRLIWGLSGQGRAAIDAARAKGAT